MFTGVVETIGTVRGVEPLGEGKRLSIGASFAGDLAIAADGGDLLRLEHPGQCSRRRWG